MKFPETTSPESAGWKRKLATASQFSTFLLTAFGGFYSAIAPPDDNLRFWPSYASVLAGFAFLGYKYLHKHRKIIMGGAIVLAIVLPIYYFAKYQELTAKYTTYRVICGTHYTAQAEKYLGSHANISKDELVFDFSGVTTDIWTEESINQARLILGLIYSSAFALLALALLMLLQESKRTPATQDKPRKLPRSIKKMI